MTVFHLHKKQTGYKKLYYTITQVLYTNLAHLLLINNTQSNTTVYLPMLSAPRGIMTSAYFFVYETKYKLNQN